MSLGSVDANGVWIYGEDDIADGTASGLLNLGMESISATIGPAEARARKHFQWANDSERLGQSGMVNGDDGYQSDTSVLYLRVGGVWKPWESDWISYTSTLGQASGTFAIGTGGGAEKTTKYKYVGGKVLVSIKIVLGSSGASMGTTPTFTLPFNAVQPVPQYGLLGRSITIHDANVPASLLQAEVRLLGSSQSVVTLYSDQGSLAGITSSAPITWAGGDMIVGEFWMEAA